MPKLTLRPSGEVFEISAEQNLLEALREREIYIKSSCGGHATCTDCVVKVVSGEDVISPPPFEEIQLLGNVFHITKERLACQARISGDVTIDITKHDIKQDQARLLSKTFAKRRPHTKVRKKEEVQKNQAIKSEEQSLENKSRDEKDGEWFRHWEKEKSDTTGVNPDRRNRKLGGGRRPRPFRTDHLEQDPDDPSDKS